MKGANAHSPNLNIVGRFNISSPNFGDICINGIVDPSTELGILIKIGKVWFGKVNLIGTVELILLFLVLQFFSFTHRKIVDHCGIELQLFLCIVKLFKFFRINAQSLREFHEHLFKFLNFISQLIFLCC